VGGNTTVCARQNSVSSPDLDGQLVTRFPVARREQEPVVDQRPGDGHALLLAAGELGG
jgi:hypothetical protein